MQFKKYYLNKINYDIIFFSKTIFVYINKTHNNIVIKKEHNTLTLPLENYEFFYKEGLNFFFLISIYKNKIIIKKVSFNLKIKINVFNLNIYEKNIEISNIYMTAENKLVLFLYPIKKYLIINKKNIFLKNSIFKELHNNKEYEFKYINLINNTYIIKNSINGLCHSNIISNNNFHEIFILKNHTIGLIKKSESFEVYFFKNNNYIHSFTYKGKFISYLYSSEYLFISFIYLGKYFIVKLNDKNIKKEKYIIKESLSFIKLINIINNHIIYEEDSLFTGIKIINQFNNKYIKFLSKNTYNKVLTLKVHNSKNLNYTSISNSKYEEILIFSFHGGPESIELLTNVYDGLYNTLLNKYNIKIIIFNYPGSVTFGEHYRILPHKKWKKTLNFSFNAILKNEMSQNVKHVILLGGSFGGTATLLLKNKKCNNKIVINPLLDLNHHLKNIDYNYKSWFMKRFSRKDFNCISINALLRNNHNLNVYFLLGTNDEIISKLNIKNKQHEFDNFKYYWDNGTHSSNHHERKIKILNIIHKIIQGVK